MSEQYKQIFDKFSTAELTLADLDQVLSTTVFEDKNVKIPLFLVNVLTFTEEDQRNVILTGESSVGKTHNITESLWFFRKGKDEANTTIIDIDNATPRALIYNPNAAIVDDRTLQPIDMSKAPKKGDPQEAWQQWYELKKHMAHFIDLSKKIVVFYDLKNYDLLQNLRSLLSHDNKSDRICTYLVTDKSPSGSNKTKKVLIKGYFTALFASAHGEMDEQEASRNYLLSPNDNSEKIRHAIEMQARKMTDPEYAKWYETEPSRLGLKNRVRLIEQAQIKTVLFKHEDMQNLKDWFLANVDNLSPKANRDFPRLYALAQAWALLNFDHRERTPDNKCIYATAADIETAKAIYEPIIKCNSLGLTPEEYEIWKLIEPECDETTGLRIAEIHNIYYYHKKRRCSDKRLRGILKNFCCAGLLKEEKEGPLLKYTIVTNKQLKQAELAQENIVQKSPLLQTANSLNVSSQALANLTQDTNQQNSQQPLCFCCGSIMPSESASGLCGKCEAELANST